MEKVKANWRWESHVTSFTYKVLVYDEETELDGEQVMIHTIAFEALAHF